MGDLITVTDAGLYCSAGDFHIDPWRPVSRAVITHAHSDHATPGSSSYLSVDDAAPILRRRLGDELPLETLAWGESRSLNGTRISFHPAGHVLGSAQIRVEHRGEVWVVSGDYKRQSDPTCAPFTPVRCHVFVTEATFGLPIFRWEPPSDVIAQIFAWWQENAAAGRASVLCAYALGKSQRILAGLRAHTDERVYVHGAIETLLPIYRARGVDMLDTEVVVEKPRGHDFSRALIVAPQSASGTTWMRRFGERRVAFASGWMRVRGNRRRGGWDRGFVLSDHADWPDLLRTVEETGATRVLVTHGYTDAFARFLREQGIDAGTLETPWRTEQEE